MTILEKQGPKITDTDIVQLEEDLGFIIPPMYRSFILEYNGGQPSPDVLSIEGFSREETDISVFFGITREKGTSNIKWNVEVFSDRIEMDKYIPIACDSGGNIFALDIRTSNRESIFYFDMEGSQIEKYFVAADIYSLLDMMYSI